MSRLAIPLADTWSFGPAARRTAIVRAGLALLLALLGGYALLTAHRLNVGESALMAPGSRGVLVLDLSASTDASPHPEISNVMRRLARSNGKAGLVLFSDVAYEALPASSKAAELRSYVRFFAPPSTIGPGGYFTMSQARRQERQVSPWSSFRAGTRISSGLELARQMVEAPGAAAKDVLLISDLNDSLFDTAALTQTLQEYRRDHIRLLVVGLDPSPDNAAYFVRRAGPGIFVPRSFVRGARAARPSQGLTGSFPRALVFATILLALALAANELYGARLTWRVA